MQLSSGTRVLLNPLCSSYKEIAIFLNAESKSDIFVIQEVRPNSHYTYGLYRKGTNILFGVSIEEVTPLQHRSKRRSYATTNS